MLSPDDITQTTGALEQEPRPLVRRNTVSERRQSILQQKHTDTLPSLSIGTTEGPNPKTAWRQVVQLREENRRLRFELEETRSEMQRLITEYNALQTEFDKEVATIHSGHQQEIEQSQSHLQELIKERNQLQEAYHQLEQRYQDLYHSFHEAAEEEAHKMVAEATQTLELSPEQTPALLQSVIKTLDLHVRQAGDEHLVEALYLKREVQSIAEQLQQERQQIATERESLLLMRASVLEHLDMQRKTLKQRFRMQWATALTVTTVATLAVLIALQFATMVLFHIHFSVPLVLAIFFPLIVSGVLAALLARPLATIKVIHASAPHKQKAEKNA